MISPNNEKDKNVEENQKDYLYNKVDIIYTYLTIYM